MDNDLKQVGFRPVRFLHRHPKAAQEISEQTIRLNAEDCSWISLFRSESPKLAWVWFHGFWSEDLVFGAQIGLQCADPGAQIWFRLTGLGLRVKHRKPLPAPKKPQACTQVRP